MPAEERADDHCNDHAIERQRYSMDWRGFVLRFGGEQRARRGQGGHSERGKDCEAHDVEGMGKRPIDYSRAKDCDICRERGNAEEEMHERRVCPVTLPKCTSDKLIRRAHSVLEPAGL